MNPTVPLPLPFPIPLQAHNVLHTLKIAVPFYNEVSRGTKTAELRKNDRGFKLGDLILLVPVTLQVVDVPPSCWSDKGITRLEDVPPQPPILVQITHMVEEYTGIEPGFAMLSFHKV